MLPRTMLVVDDFPDFILEGFVDLERATGRYPRMLIIRELLAEMMNAEPGLWRPSAFGGIWHWRMTCVPDGIDEFGNLE